MSSRRSALLAAGCLIFIFALYHVSNVPGSSSTAIVGQETAEELITSTPTTETEKTPLPPPTSEKETSSTEVLSPEVLTYFDQVFSPDQPKAYNFPALQAACEQTKWAEDDVYLQCGGMSAGLTSIMSQIKVCLKMAVETGSSIVLPSMPLRDSKDLQNFNFLNGDAYLTYEEWFDASHLMTQIGHYCPKMKILHPIQLDGQGASAVAVKNKWSIDLGKAPGFRPFTSYFWAGRPFKAFFEQQYADLEGMASLSPDRDETKKGITIVSIASSFLLFRITDDPTGQELRLWNDLGQLIRFRDAPRKIIGNLLPLMDRPFYGVHFRAENDTIWSSPEHQLKLDLEALDTAWAKYGTPTGQKPLVYLACGDQDQVEMFVTAGKANGWDVTHKWKLAQGNPEVLKMINDLAFDFQGAVDMGVMVKSDFFMGIQGSAFSSTIGNARDVTGRYRGSSFTVYDDGNARTHLFNDGDATAYACCL
ncbi:hypothetical protein LOCC1_G008696 [Lachnellula occidentalis]|uniref:Uncharacterized protein n=1 Tax=Lachnellula occidentalis TaxID=215460 RepID=A0A8H8REJ9_9HELO|nr:hypothetical protein LOCC1_G008696 [Lachnellula occidentalis]